MKLKWLLLLVGGFPAILIGLVVFMTVASVAAGPPESGSAMLTDDGLFLLWPVESHRITSPFGVRVPPEDRSDTQEEFHWGVDIGEALVAPVYAANDGTVTVAGGRGNYGNLVVLTREDGLQTWYGHLSAFEVKVGDKVAAGDVIGRVGTSGRSTGPHLHFEVRPQGQPVDPLAFYGPTQNQEGVDQD